MANPNQTNPGQQPGSDHQHDQQKRQQPGQEQETRQPQTQQPGQERDRNADPQRQGGGAGGSDQGRQDR